jgi:hypothetical protein
MLRSILAATLFLTAGALAADAPPSKIDVAAPVHQTIEDHGAKYNVTVNPEAQTVEVTREGPTLNSPPQLRLRIRRDPKPPIDVRLQALQPLNEPAVRYSGRIDKWNQSYMGFELQFSFDKKTWSRLGELFR